jgi:hypothetical protein
MDALQRAIPAPELKMVMHRALGGNRPTGSRIALAKMSDGRSYPLVPLHAVRHC